MGPAAARAGLRARAAPVGGRGAAWLRVSEFVDGPRPRALTNIEKWYGIRRTTFQTPHVRHDTAVTHRAPRHRGHERAASHRA